MDFKELVKSGQYSREDLNESQNAYVDGLDRSIDDIYNALENMKMDSDGSLLSQIKLEVMKEFADTLADEIESDICEYIVAQSEGNMDDNGQDPQGGMYDEPMQEEPEPMQEMQPQRYGSRMSRKQTQPMSQPQQYQQQAPQHFGRGNGMGNNRGRY